MSGLDFSGKYLKCYGSRMSKERTREALESCKKKKGNGEFKERNERK